MKTIPNDMVVFSDVDETLILYDHIKYWEPSEGLLEIIHPLNNELYYVNIHHEHVKLLRSYKAQGYTVIVWSAQGYQWSETVVLALNLEDTVDFCMSKPVKYVDDLHAKDILVNRVYIIPGIQNRTIEPGEQE